MSVPIQKVFALAKKTFARVKGNDGRRKHILSKDDFYSHLDELSALMATLTASDLGLDQSAAVCQRQPPKAPVTYIGLHEDADLTMGIFIINPRGRMPLHNHPKMHGVLKVVHGNVQMSHFNRISALNVPEDLPVPLRTRLELLDQGVVVPTQHPTRVTAGADSKPFLLSPNENNFHEIQLVDDDNPAAFVDILSPPYNQEISEDGLLEIPEDEPRDCDFFQPLKLQEKDGGSPDITWLHRLTQQPSEYFCDAEPYKGPSLNGWQLLATIWCFT